MRPLDWPDERRGLGYLARTRLALLISGLVLALFSAGCANTSSKDRDLNAEAMRQMGYWGGEPGY